MALYSQPVLGVVVGGMLIGMVTTNVIFAVNHKPGRYHSNYAETMAELTSDAAQVVSAANEKDQLANS